MKNKFTNKVLLAIIAASCLSAPATADDGFWTRLSSKNQTQDINYELISSPKKSKSYIPSWMNPTTWWKSPQKRSYQPEKKVTMTQRMSRTSKRWWENMKDWANPYPNPSSSTGPAVETNKSAWALGGSSSSSKSESPMSLPDFLRQETPK